MRVFLQIEIGDWKQRNYNNLLVPFASSLADDLIGTDIDNESEAAVIDLVIKLIDQAESVFVFVATSPDAAMGSADKMMRYMLQHPGKIQRLVLLGDHPAIEKYTQNFEVRFLKAKDTEEVKKLIQDFAMKTPTPGRTAGLVP